jgi:hypothetical protein
MRNGQLISIDDMDINHLRNTLKMIVKNSNSHQVKLNGDMANEFNDMSDDAQDDTQYAYEY